VLSPRQRRASVSPLLIGRHDGRRVRYTGTIPSKTLREAIFQLTGLTVKALYGNGFEAAAIFCPRPFLTRPCHNRARDRSSSAQLKRNGVAIYQATHFFWILTQWEFK